MEFQIDVEGVLGGLAELEKFPKAGLRRVMRQATNVIKDAEQHNAPLKTGLLRSSIQTREENTKTPYKASFRVTFKRTVDKNGNATKAAGLVRNSNGKRAYYPAALEYGWRMRNGEEHPGLHYAQKSGDEVSEKVKQMIVDEFDNVIDGVMNGTLTSTGGIIRNRG